jgi:FkbM family methyltransferase
VADDLRALDDASLLRAIAELYAPGAPEPELASLCATLAGREIALAVPGGTVRVDLGDWTAILMVRLGAWEPHLLGLARALVHSDAIAIDVGAHVGAWTMLLASLVGPSGRVIACEPFGPSAARARAMVESAGLGERVRVIETAIGDRAGTARLYAARDSMLRSLVPGADATDYTEVPLATLDSLGVERADVIKIDTEGFELAVLRGGRELLARCDPALIIELHAEQLVAQRSSTADVYSELRAQGFTVFDLRPEGTDLVVEPLREHPTTNHVLARRDPSGFVVPLR